MGGEAEREMTLDEWCATLPEHHRARRELTALCAEVERLRAEVAAAERRGAERALRWARPEWGPGQTYDFNDESQIEMGLSALYPEAPTTPNPRNAPPMTDRDRLVEIVQRFQWNRTMDSLVDTLLAEGVTLPPRAGRWEVSHDEMCATMGRLLAGLSAPLSLGVLGAATAPRNEMCRALGLRGWFTAEEATEAVRAYFATTPAPGGPDGR